MQQSLNLGFSPCPNDTYIFHALAQKRIALEPLSLRIFMGDVEELNREVRAGRLDMAKVSIHAMVHLLRDYCLLRSGGAMGRGCGPVIVSREKLSMRDLKDRRMAIPGRMTTAGLLLQLEGTHQGPKEEMVFHEIMPAVLEGRVDAGVVIHEGRFTFHEHGLHLVLDLGAWWENETELPLPLGGIVMKRKLGEETARFMEEKIRESLAHSRAHPHEAWPYMRKHAQEMDSKVIHQHIQMFVNDYTHDVGPEGEKAIRHMLKAAATQERLATPQLPLFCTQGKSADTRGRKPWGSL